MKCVPSKDLLKHTGYIHGGCSPIGMKKPFRTFVDESAILLERMFFSAGKIGARDIETAPAESDPVSLVLNMLT